MVRRQAALVAVPDVPGWVAGGAPGQLGIQGARCGATGEHQVEDAMRGDGPFGMPAQGLGQGLDEGVSVRMRAPLGRFHGALRQAWSSLSNRRAASAGPQLPAG